jgi:hypothetical protein
MAGSRHAALNEGLILTQTPGGTKKWLRSTYCADNACVEVATDGDLVLMRDAKRTDQPHLGFDRDSWAHFVAEIKGDRFQTL